MTLTPRDRLLPFLLLLPAAGFLAFFFLVPLADVFWLSVSEPSLSLAHYGAFFSEPFHLKVLANTFLTATFVTLAALLLGYPLAYVMARIGGPLALILVAVVAMSFWTSFLVRTYAWLVILGNKGPAVWLMTQLGVQPAPQLLFTRFSSGIALVHAMLPFMVMSLYAIMRKIEPAYLRAAKSLGATPWSAFRHIFLPLSAPGIVNGCTLVFITCLGFYVIPVLLGSPREQMIAGVIGHQIEEFLAFGEASAMAVVLLAITLALFGLYNRVVGLDKLWG